MQKLLIANWKLNPLTLPEAIRLGRAEDKKGVVISPPFPFVGAVGKALRYAALGAQDAFWESPPAGGGPYTGEVSPAMLKKLGVRYVILGHSERRRWLGETDKMINRKVRAAMAAGLKVILCVGEPKEVRRRGIGRAMAYVKNQLRADLKGARGSLVIAYEPIWAIGTGKPDNPKETVEIARFIKRFVRPRPRVLYGGSVTSRNTKNFLQYKDIDGALVGGASLKAVEFKKIITITKKLQ
ncbi:triose-phosphate isomerase [Candidatus Parcubacteria bacterium]|nr:MAG: triose-phosphate isomerase [Candidatus Parcubacteria bacterium]